MDIQQSLAEAIALAQSPQPVDAESVYLDILTHVPDHAEAAHRLGALYMELQRPQEAIPYLQQTLERFPDANNVLRNLTIALQGVHRYEEALVCYDKILKTQPELTAGHFQKGACLQALRRFEEALVCYKTVLKLEPENAAAHAKLGLLYQDVGDKESAIDCYRQSLVLQPASAPIHRALAMLEDHSSYGDDIKAMEVLYDQSDTTPLNRLHLGYGLGKSFDDLKQFDKAFKYFLAANQLSRAQLPYNRMAMESYFQSIKTHALSGVANRPSPTLSEGHRLIFIVGMPRSGTSLTEQIIASHPRVHGVGESQAMHRIQMSIEERTGEFYPAATSLLSEKDWSELRANYLQETFVGAGDAEFVTDKMPGNFTRIGLISKLFPDAKIVNCQRDPMAICVSMFVRLFPGTHPYSNDLGDLGHFFKLYKDLMGHWNQNLSGRVYHSCYESLTENFEPNVRELLKYCELEFRPECLEFYKSNRAVQTASHNQVRRPVHGNATAAWKRFETHLGPLRAALQD